MRRFTAPLICLALTCWSGTPHAQDAPWRFAVAGDSRDCGNVVMPAIAAGARSDHAAFYWHLGDFRAIFRVDQDFAAEHRFTRYRYRPTISDYLDSAWVDFVQHQLAPFGDMPVFLGIGNHEVIPPKTVTQYRIEFLPYLDRTELREQRQRDAARGNIPETAPDQTYAHWTYRGVDFINLDNTLDDAFDEAQLQWLDAVIEADLADPAVKSLVVGMHDPLPHSRAGGHDMGDSEAGLETGMRVYRRLIDAQRRKPVYVVATHAHYYLANIFDTARLKSESGGKTLPGWIIGTAGAERYGLPDGVSQGEDAKEHVYGYLLGQVSSSGDVQFAFQELDLAALQAARTSDYDEQTVRACFAGNPLR